MTTRDIAENDNDLFDTLDAHVWAERFVERATGNPTIPTDVGTMLAWFAGSIMTGYDAGLKVGRAMAHAEQAEKMSETPVNIKPSSDKWHQPSYPSYPGANPVVGSCGACGLQLSQVMNYVCMRPGCPTGLGGSTTC